MLYECVPLAAHPHDGGRGRTAGVWVLEHSLLLGGETRAPIVTLIRISTHQRAPGRECFILLCPTLSAQSVVSGPLALQEIGFAAELQPRERESTLAPWFISVNHGSGCCLISNRL